VLLKAKEATVKNLTDIISLNDVYIMGLSHSLFPVDRSTQVYIRQAIRYWNLPVNMFVMENYIKQEYFKTNNN